MGRISKRNSALKSAAVRRSKSVHEGRRYKAGIYARLSSAYGHKSCGQAINNESAEVQIEIAKKFVEEFNRQETGEAIDIVECYIDLGKTGSNFQRDGFLRLIQDIRIGKINCVIVKDLSRFGRDYLEAGNYIEKIFPFLGVRFIAAADSFDTGRKGNGSNQLALEIKNLVNDMYAKDFSQKAKQHLKKCREEGSYVGGPPPYGYKAVWDGSRRVLMPDGDTENIVRFIYEEFAGTESYAAVTDELNRRQINPPYMYKKTNEVYHTAGKGDYKGWDRSAVERILKSRTYAGTLVQGKTCITARNEKNRIQKPEGEWVVTECAHMPLIGEGLYNRVGEARQKIESMTAAHKHSPNCCPIEENIFKNVLYCGVCGRKMMRRSYVKQYADGKKERLYGYFCPNGGNAKVALCHEPNRISGNRLLDILLPLIRMEFDVLLGRTNHYMEYGREIIAQDAKKSERIIKEVERKTEFLYEEEGSLYIDYRTGKIPQSDYTSYKMKIQERMDGLRRRQEGMEKEKSDLCKLEAEYSAGIKEVLKMKNRKCLTRDMAESFIFRIYVYPGKRAEVLFAFTSGGMEVDDG